VRVREEPGDNTGVISEASSALDAFVRGARETRKRPANGSAKGMIDRARGELDGLAEGGWERALPRHLVALYARLHEEVYGVAPADVEQRRAFLAACSAAGKLLREEFGGEGRAAIEFMRWAWRRERAGVRRRHARGESSDWRVTWQQQFVSRRLLTDYRVWLRREGQGGAL